MKGDMYIVLEAELPSTIDPTQTVWKVYQVIRFQKGTQTEMDLKAFMVKIMERTTKETGVVLRGSVTKVIHEHE